MEARAIRGVCSKICITLYWGPVFQTGCILIGPVQTPTDQWDMHEIIWISNQTWIPNCLTQTVGYWRFDLILIAFCYMSGANSMSTIKNRKTSLTNWQLVLALRAGPSEDLMSAANLPTLSLPDVVPIRGTLHSLAHCRKSLTQRSRSSWRTIQEARTKYLNKNSCTSEDIRGHSAPYFQNVWMHMGWNGVTIFGWIEKREVESKSQSIKNTL